MVLISLSKCATKALLRNLNHIPITSTNTKAQLIIPHSQNINLSVVLNFCHTCKVNHQALGNIGAKMNSRIICADKNNVKNTLWKSVKSLNQQTMRNRTKVYMKGNQQNNTGSKIYSKFIGKYNGKSTAKICTINMGRYSGRTMVQVVRSFVTRILRTPQTIEARLGRLMLGSVFFTPPKLFQNVWRKEEKPNIPELPKEHSVRRSRGVLQDFLWGLYEMVRVWVRAIELALIFGPIAMLYPITFLGKGATEAWWSLLLTAIEFSGPIFIKLGQWMSTRRDLFPEACCSQFSRLQRRVAPHSWHFTAYRMKRAFGPNWRKIFVKFDNNGKPIGSGCVAQVYKVWMDTDYLADDELVDEILSELDDSPSIYEGMEVLGFGSIFTSDNFDVEEEQAVSAWREERKAKREREEHERRLQQQNKVEETAPSEGSILSETDMISIVENVANEVMNVVEEQTSIEEPKEAVEEISEEEPSLSLVEEWQEGPLDKSLPIVEAPPDDLEGLIPVAIKVLHPGVVTAFRRDLRILRCGAWFVSCLWPPLHWLSLQQCVNEFAQVLEGQINLKKEAEHLELFSENFSDILNIKFPRPLRPYVTTRVLVETFEEGDNMLDVILASQEDVSSELRKNLARIGVDALMKMVFMDNLVHGDLHPGNILVQNINKSGPNGSSPSDNMQIMMVDVGCDTFVIDVQPDPNPLRLCILDCGVVSKLSDANLKNIRAVFKQVVLGDGESVAELFLNNSIHQCPDPEAFKAEISDLVDSAREKTVSLGQVDVGLLLQNVLSVLLRHRVRLESAFSAVVLAIFVLEGLGRTLDPEMDILERARPVLVTGKVAS